MVSISHETPGDTAARLAGVLALADIRWLEARFAFESVAGMVASDGGDAIAMVRFDDAWSALRPASGSLERGEAFSVARISFPVGADNSGFVGWLAGQLKAQLGTGVIVICGSDARVGGIFDYWGIPEQLRSQAEGVFASLVSGEG